ncbi:MAG: PIN domain nuclease [Pseudonocardiales bacterium]|nr:PIN domain nuclease [Actinomycetota bacterium]PZS23107.1 MAG: PIN domain nuclease [Pseudonocardiales bacterium]
MTLVLDAGALIAYEQGDRTVRAFLERAGRTGVDVRTTTGAVAQVWRDGARQARLTLLLKGLLEVELTRERARRIGILLRQADERDVIDGSIVEAAVDGDEILTTDPDDIAALAEHSGKNLIVTRV